MGVPAEPKSIYPASFVLPLSDEIRSIDGWLELDPERVAFRNGQGLELAMRIDRVAGISLPAVPKAAPAPERTDVDSRATPQAGVGVQDPDLDETDDGNGPLGIMRLAGDCGPVHVAWELLISPHDARTLGEELSAALGGTDLRTAGLDPYPEVITLEREGEVDDEPVPPPVTAGLARLFAWRPRRPRIRASKPKAECGDSDDPERHAVLIRRRRIVAMILLAAALVIAIELVVTLFLLPG